MSGVEGNPGAEEITTALITGDDISTSVFASSFTYDLSITFEFRPDDESKGTNHRIVSCFHGLKVPDTETFPDRAAMREAIHALVKQVWPQCSKHIAIRMPDVIVQVDEYGNGEIRWCITHGSEYEIYLRSLKTLKSLEDSLHIRDPRAIAISALRIVKVLGGRGDTTLVRHVGDTDAVAEKGGLYVFKGLSFRSLIEVGDIEFEGPRDAFYRELDVICSLPKHPNIISPPVAFVKAELTTLTPNGDALDKLVCGALWPYLENKSIQEAIDSNQGNEAWASLTKFSKWAYQISSAIATAHEAGQYHMDIKPNNILLDDAENAILIDWEQFSASPFFLAPEASGKFDAEEVPEPSSTSGDKKIVYSKYTGPARRNNWGHPEWNVFPIWQWEAPLALEVAEVYSVGRTLWVIFERFTEDAIEDDRASETPRKTTWTSEHIPEAWKDFVDTCLGSTRPRLEEVVRFWLGEYTAYEIDSLAVDDKAAH